MHIVSNPQQPALPLKHQITATITFIELSLKNGIQLDAQHYLS